MVVRLNYGRVAPGGYTAMGALDQYLATCGQRLYSLDAWKECPYYSEHERVAPAWTEAVTFVANGHIGDGVYAQAKSQFTDKELADLTLAIAAINAWNRLSIAGRLTPGTYQAQKAAV